MENKSEELNVCQVFIENETLFGCVEPIKYKVIFDGMGVEGFSCQRHYEFTKSEVERNEMSAMVKFVEINNDK